METLKIEGFPLSPLQARSCSVHRNDPHGRFAILIEGAVEFPALHAGIEEMVERHEILHTTYRSFGGMQHPLQVIGRATFTWDEPEDLSQEEKQAKAVGHLLQKMSPADGEERASLHIQPILLSPHERLILVSMPPLALDSSAPDFFIAELARVLGAHDEGITLAPAMQYADFAAWQNDYLRELEPEKAQNYWNHANSDANPNVVLPFQRNNPDPFRPAVFELGTLADPQAELEALPLTASQFLLACWRIFLYGWTTEGNLTMGVYRNGRHHEELAGMLGPTGRYLPLNARIEPDTEFAFFLEETSTRLEELDEYQDSFFWELLESTSPIMFAFEYHETAFKTRAAGLSFSLWQDMTPSEPFTLRLVCRQAPGGLNLHLVYAEGCLHPHQVAGMAAGFRALVKDGMARPNARIGTLRLLGEQEQRRLLRSFNRRDASRETGDCKACIHQFFEARAARTPDLPAVIYADSLLTYAALDQRANQIAHALRKVGAGPDTRVGLCMERNPDMITAVMGIWKAGAAYLPLEPSDPPARLAFMLRDSKTRWVITREDPRKTSEGHLSPAVAAVPLREKLAAWLRDRDEVSFLDMDSVPITHKAETEPSARVTGNNLAYAIYTSGSTGMPKGVSVEHRSPLNLRRGLEKLVYGGNRVLRISMNAPITFDASVQQIVMLTAGYCLCIVPQETRLNGTEFVGYLRRHAIEGLDCTPTHLKALVDSGLLSTPGLKLAKVLVAGGAIDQGLWDTLATSRTIRFFDIYGPTECTVDATGCRIDRPVIEPSIGPPLLNYRMYLLNQFLRLVPAGIPGELCIAGAGLARGYLARPDLTAARFMPHPFADSPGERLYKTGDLARFLEDRRPAFLGRIDQQLKLRGYRIEPGEIEAQIRAIEGIKDAVVIAGMITGSDEQQLVAYIVGDFQAANIRSLLGNIFPEHMVPVWFLPLKALPLTASGKLNRDALPEPAPKSTKTAPRTPAEALLAGIWESLLGRRELGVEESFFELGGHSLLATRLVNRVSEAFDVELPLRVLFDHPSIEKIAAYLEEKRPNRETKESPLIRNFARGETAPLSHAQERLWFLNQAGEGAAAYNLPTYLELRGTLDVVAFESSAMDVIRRHEVLRTGFSMRAGKPVQVLQSTVTGLFPLIDLSELPREERHRGVEELANHERLHPFDLSTDPPLRKYLLRIDGENHVLLLTMHHIISDEWSVGTLVNELTLFYRSRLAGETALPHELPIQFADFAIWQREWLKGPALQGLLDYWKRQLAHAPRLLELPGYQPRPPVRTFRGALEPVVLQTELSARLEDLSRQWDVTLFMTLQAAFAVLLSRYSNQEDVCVGFAVANRTRKEVEPLIGFFLNTLVLRTDLAGNPRWLTLLRKVRQTAHDALAHQDLPFGMVIEAVQPERDQSHDPLYQVMFDLRNKPAESLRLPGVELSPLAVEQQTAKYDLTLSLMRLDAGIEGYLEFNTDLFDRSSVQRMMRHFANLLEDITAVPERTVAALELLDVSEKREMLWEWNQTQKAWGSAGNLPQWFERQASLSPSSIAVSMGKGGDGPPAQVEDELTYADLNARANQLASYLNGLMVGPDVVVGVCLPRSPAMVVSLLAVLKAGGAYLPLDPNLPGERLAFMIQDSGLTALVTDSALLDLLPIFELNFIHTIVLDEDQDRIAAVPETNPPPSPGSENLAYLIYTSGSSGVPKAVEIVHGGLNNYLQWCLQHYSISGGAGAPVHTSIGFDATITALWPPLLSGGKVLLLPEKENVEALGAALYADPPHSLIKLTPAHLELLSGFLSTDRGEVRARALVVGGEALTAASLSPWQKHAPLTKIFNEYGPTEAVVGCCVYPLPSDRPAREPILIGRPIANTRLYVLDRHLQVAPLGVYGQLFIGGAGLARGYRNRPHLTAEKFIPDPFAEQPGPRLYQSGDRVRYRPDANLEFAGRRDHQVKLRGFRVELGEIEAVLGDHPSLAVAIVLLRKDMAGHGQLVAYVLPFQNGPKPSEKEAPDPELPQLLRDYLKKKMPDYMIPAVFVALEELPLTPNGKVDREALPEPEESRRESANDHVPAKTRTEQMLSMIWAEVLELERVGVRSNFFDLGGHSLLAATVISRIREKFLVELPIDSIFRHTSVETLSGFIDEMLLEQKGAALVLIEPVARDRPLPLSFAQERLWFLDQFEGPSATYNIPAALRLDGFLDVRALERSAGEILYRHEILRTVFSAPDGSPLQHIEAPSTMTIEVVALAHQSGNDDLVHLLAETEALEPFDLIRGPLVRLILLRQNRKKHVLLFTMHHIVSDGWSVGVLVQELAALYEAFILDQPSPLQALSIQYADYASWQREYLAGELMEKQLDFWKLQLADPPGLLGLPTDHPRPPVQSYHGGSLFFKLSQDSTRALKQLSLDSGTTHFMCLQTVFAVLLSRYSGQKDIWVGSPVANRNRAEFELLIGLFVNTLVLRTDLTREPSTRELLARVRKTALDSYGHQDLPFEQVVERFQPDRNLSFSPLFQVMFILQNQPDKDLKLPGLTLGLLELDELTAKFDLTLSIVESEGIFYGVFSYAVDLFEAASIQCIADHFCNLVKAMTAAPDERIERISLLDEAERKLLLTTFNETRQPFPKTQLVHQFFEARAVDRPDAVALVCESTRRRTRRFSYAAMDQQSEELAGKLRTLGVGPDIPVGICTQRDAPMLIGLLGILKAGGTYVPLDPAYPRRRLAFTLEDAGISVLLTQSSLIGDLPSTERPPIPLDEKILGASVGKLGEPGQSGGRARLVGPQNLSHLIYTSGSTGTPKGVALSHLGASLFLDWIGRVFSAKELRGVLASTSICFDLSFFEIFAPLSRGGSVILVRNVLELAEMTARNEVTAINTIPSAMVELLSLKAVPPSVRLVNLAGEALRAKLARQLHELVPPPRVLNLYGPSEDTTYSTFMEIPLKADALPGIGKPLDNTQVYLLDEGLQPVPLGLQGELFLGGEGLARGYYGLSGLTAEKFIPHPFAGQGRAHAGRRLYHTGDCARYQPNGNLEFLGRVDHQVKLRGFRIELGEIETALAEHRAVLEAVVIIREWGNEDRRIVSFVELEGGNDADLTGLKAELLHDLGSRLPGYMIPTEIVILETLPRTPNGKIDRKSLPALSEDKSVPGPAHDTPKTAIEETLSEIWMDILAKERVGIHTNFFNAGGHSLLATRVVSRIRDVFGLELPVRALFETPTISELGLRIEDLRGQGRNHTPILPAPRGTSIPMSFAQQRLWFLYRVDLQSPFYNMPLALSLRGRLSYPHIEKALKYLMARHENLRTAFADINGMPSQLIATDPPLRLQLVDFRSLGPRQDSALVEAIIDREANRPFALDDAPLWRSLILRLNQSHQVICFTMHHIISDGWSMSILSRELMAVYGAFRSGGEPDLPVLGIQYADFSQWQNRWFEEGALEEQLAYWTHQLEGAPARVDLISDFPRPRSHSYRGKVIDFYLDAELVNHLSRLYCGQGASLFMTLLAAFKILLLRYSNQTDLVIGTAVANRNHSEIEGLIGFFVNTLIIRTRLPGRPTFAEVLARVRETALDAYAHQDLPFNLLVEELQPERKSTANPLFNIMFALQNTPDSKLEVPGVTLDPLPLQRETAKFEMFLSFSKEAGGGLFSSWEFQSDLFETASVALMSTRFQHLLIAIVADPHLPIDLYSLMDDQEKQRLLHEARGRETSIPAGLCIGELFESAVVRNPGQTALSGAGPDMSYETLNAHADRLAFRLRELGLSAGEPVAVCMHRSPEMIAALLAILKAGGFYVGIDTRAPESRLHRIFSDGGIQLAVTHAPWCEPLPDLPLRVLNVNHEAPKQKLQDSVKSGRHVYPRQLAYASYTSGSTGTPKGVAVTHRAVLRLLLNVTYVELGPRETLLQFAPLAFDASTFEIWGALLHGSRLVVVTASQPSLEELGKIIGEQRVSTLWLTATLFNLMTEEHPEDLVHVRQLIVGGEALSPPHILRSRKKLPRTRLINGYGPTEGTTFTTTHRIGDEPLIRKSIPIGRPIDNTTVYLLDARMEPVASGQPGELCIAGEGLARGYLNDFTQTASRFVPDPFALSPGDRLYRSGDRVRGNHHAEIEFLERIDDQVKIRGFRVELSEIRHVLEKHKSVAAAVVRILNRKTGDKCVIAYIQPNKENGAPASREEDERSQVEQWQMVFDERIYSDVEDYEDPTLNLSGWVSSYSGEIIPREQMVTWLEDTVEKIQFLQPKHVLELGCGTGLLLFRIAPGCASYTGSDISEVGLNHIRNHLKRPDLQHVDVKLQESAAHDFDRLPAGKFDMVILNSVVQYFPAIEYLDQVIRGSLDILGGQGTIFIGDVRNFRLLEHLHADLALFQSSAETSFTDWAEKLRRGIAGESELLIDPAYFHQLKHRYPSIGHIEVLHKRGETHNELTLFRYDVQIHAGPLAVREVSWRDWSSGSQDVEKIGETLRLEKPEVLAVTGIPNRRLARPALLVEALHNEDSPPVNLAILKQEPHAPGSVDPHCFWDMATELGYRIFVRDAGPARETQFELLFVTGEKQPLIAASDGSRSSNAALDITRYANRPILKNQERRIAAELKEHLTWHLPDYMLPEHIMVLEAFPLTAGGKVDHRALPAPQLDRSPSDTDYVAPRTPTEQILASIWTELLHVDQVGPADHFFDLGGHSLMATQVVSRVRKVFEVDFTLRMLFEIPNLGEQAALLESLRNEHLQSPPIQPVPRNQTLSLSFSQEQLWLAHHMAPDSSAYNMPTTLRLQGPLDQELIDQVFAEITRRHEVLRTNFHARDGKPMLKIHSESRFLLQAVDLSGTEDPEAAVKQTVLQVNRRPFDLANDPLLHANIFKLGSDQYIIAFIMHHIISDGWSLSVLVGEIASLYQSYIRGETSALPELPIQYADLAFWQRSWMRGKVLEEHLDYWRSKVGGKLPVLKLPFDRPRVESASSRGGRVQHYLEPALARELRALSRREGTTLYMTLLAGFSVLLHRYGQEDLLIGMPVAGRDRLETEHLIGCLINMLVLRIDLTGNPTFLELLARVRGVALEALEYQNMPFEKLVRELNPTRDQATHPFFQLTFGLQNAPGGELQLPGLKLTPYQVEGERSRYDLTIWMAEVDDELVGQWTFSRDLFDERTIQTMADRYATLLQGIVVKPEERIFAFKAHTELEIQKEEDKLQASIQNKLLSRKRGRSIVNPPLM